MRTSYRVALSGMGRCDQPGRTRLVLVSHKMPSKVRGVEPHSVDSYPV